jgi:uncharacterized membrane protein
MSLRGRGVLRLNDCDCEARQVRLLAGNQSSKRGPKGKANRLRGFVLVVMSLVITAFLTGCSTSAISTARSTTTTVATTTTSVSASAAKTLDVQACGAIAADQQASASGRVPNTDATNFWKAVNAANGSNSQITQDVAAWLSDVSSSSDTNVYPTTAVANDCTAVGVSLYGVANPNS